MFERFTKEARDVATGSQAEARRLGHAFVGTEHILLALVQSSGLAVRVLNAAGVTVEKVQEEIPRAIGRAPLVDDEAALRMIGIDLDAVRDQIDARFGPGALERAGGRSRFGRVGSPRFTPRSKKVLELSLREAIALRHRHIGPEHILLGLLREGEGLGMAVILRLGGNADSLRAAVIGELRQVS